MVAALKKGRARLPVLAALVLTVLGANGAGAQPIPKSVTLRNYFGSMTFDRPVLFMEFPGRDSVYLVVQQSGTVIRVHMQNGAWVKSRFDSVHVTGVNGIANPRGPGEGSPSGDGDDGGLLGLAFHPEYASNRKYYVFYIDPVYPGGKMYPGTIVLAERRADSTLLAGSGDAQRVLLALPKPYVWHNGGTLRFGSDGYLRTAIGDGGNGGDPGNRAQNKKVLFGKFLRIDVDGPDAFPGDTTRNYAVPPDNPFVDSAAYLPEIWAIGLRSPWRWDFHPFTGEIWLGDVGQTAYEEITRVPRGGNLGWRLREGAFCYNPATNCPEAGLVPPVFTFPSRDYGRAVIGGVFFTGDTTAAYHGLYIFGDIIRGRIWAMREHDGALVDTAQIALLANVSSIDRDRRGNVFATMMRVNNSNWVNTGVVNILQSPDMRLAPKPVRIAAVRKTPSRPLAYADVLKNRERYLITSLDGRRISGDPVGAFLVRERGVDGPPRLMTTVW